MLSKQKSDENKPHKKKEKKIPHRGINKNNNKPISQTLPSTPGAPSPPSSEFSIPTPSPTTSDVAQRVNQSVPLCAHCRESPGWRPSLIDNEQGTERRKTKKPKTKNQKPKNNNNNSTSPSLYPLPPPPPPHPRKQEAANKAIPNSLTAVRGASSDLTRLKPRAPKREEQRRSQIAPTSFSLFPPSLSVVLHRECRFLRVPTNPRPPASLLCGTHCFTPETETPDPTPNHRLQHLFIHLPSAAALLPKQPAFRSTPFERAHPNRPHFHTHPPTHSQTLTRKPGVLGDSKTPPSMRASHPAKKIPLHPNQKLHHFSTTNHAQFNSIPPPIHITSSYLWNTQKSTPTQS